MIHRRWSNTLKPSIISAVYWSTIGGMWTFFTIFNCYLYQRKSLKFSENRSLMWSVLQPWVNVKSALSLQVSKESTVHQILLLPPHAVLPGMDHPPPPPNITSPQRLQFLTPRPLSEALHPIRHTRQLLGKRCSNTLKQTKQSNNWTGLWPARWWGSTTRMVQKVIFSQELQLDSFCNRTRMRSTKDAQSNET